MFTGGTGTIASTIVDQLLGVGATEVIVLSSKLVAMSAGNR